VDGDAALLEVNIGALKKPDLGSPESVTVGHGKDSPVSFTLDDREQAAHLILGQEGDGGIWPLPSWWGCFPSDYHGPEISLLSGRLRFRWRNSTAIDKSAAGG
jgi:hypothetical protein